MQHDPLAPPDFLPPSSRAPGLSRRSILKMVTGLAAASQLGLGSGLVPAAARKPVANGKPGDFDFLTGNWKIQNRRLKDKAWDEFEGEATVYGLVGGVISVEELRIPARKFAGVGLRLLDLKNKLWADFFVNAQSGVLGGEPAWGSFVNGVGTWDSDDQENDKPIIARGVWDEITPNSCRWFQAVSRDDGKTWEENWVMRWKRV